MDLLKQLGDEIRNVRRERKWTRAELADKAGLSERFLAEMEAGRGNIAITRLQKLCEALGVSLAELMADLPSARSGKTKTSRNYSGILSILAGCDEKQMEDAFLLLSQRFNNKRNRIALIGLREAGKTTIGKKLATRLRRRFVELDEQVEKSAGLTLQNIFEVHGEEYYRKLEYDALAELLSESRSGVIATGGGIVLREQTYALLREHCLTFWLKADPEDHWKRVLEQDPRPIRNYPNAFAQLQNLLTAREPLYSQADSIIDTSSLSPNESVRRIMSELNG